MHKGCHVPFHYSFLPHQHHWRRRFLTEEEKKEKKVKWMELYKDYLEKELKGVNEQLEKLVKE